MLETLLSPLTITVAVASFIALVVAMNSLHMIGQTEVGLVTKRLGLKLPDDNPIALNGEAGYQADLLMPGLRFMLWPIFSVKRSPWVQVPAGEIGVVIAQVGKALPIGAKSATYKSAFGNFSNARTFLANDGQKGVQRPVLTPGTLVPIHPIAFLVITKQHVYGVPVASDMVTEQGRHGRLSPASFGLIPEQLSLVGVQPKPKQEGGGTTTDVVGIVTTLEGDPLPSGYIAGRLGGFQDVEKMEADGKTDAEIIEVLLGSKNGEHNNYQDFQEFIAHGGRIGLQHDPLLYGAYALNPFLVRVEIVPMVKVQQGEVAVVKAYVGLPTKDTSGEGFKHGSLVHPGHRGIWQEPLRTGKYPINPRCYQVEIVPTAILTLNWAEAVSQAHSLDQHLKQITAKSREGFVFQIDLQVQIHVPDTKAPRVISRVGTMQNLVNEVLQSAVGNHFRDKLQSLEAVKFIETRQLVQQEALAHIKHHLEQYEVETSGVYIQDVMLPEELVAVLTQREIANQEIQTFEMQKKAQDQRVAMENAKGVADQQAALARSKVGIDIKGNDSEARKKEAEGEAAFIRQTGEARGKAIEAEGVGRATGYQKQVEALGQNATAVVNAVTALSGSSVRLVPDVLVTGGGGGSMEGVMAVLLQALRGKAVTGAETRATPTAQALPAPTDGATPRVAATS
ncbi:MAG: SPFH domain-containing protein [bacterium]|nr:SPFH domain-containing protein [bacterium]